MLLDCLLQSTFLIMKETIEMYLYLIFVFDTERMFPTMREPIETNMSETYVTSHMQG